MRNRELEYRHLEAFRAIMRSGSVTGAGSLLGVSQPAVSRLLAQTEDLAGFPLFERVRGRLVPTAAAEQLYEETERIFVGVKEISTLCTRLREGASRRILIGSLPVLTLALLPSVALAWGRTARAGVLSIHSRTAGAVLGLVASGQVDLGLSLGLPRVPGVRSAPLARVRFLCAMAPDHPLARHERIGAELLDDVPFIALSRDELSQERIDKVMREAGIRPREVVECRLVSGAAAMAALGVGVTLVDPFSVAPFLGQGLVMRPFEPAVHLDYRIMWPEHVADTFGRADLIAIIRAKSRAVIEHVARCRAADHKQGEDTMPD